MMWNNSINNYRNHVNNINNDIDKLGSVIFTLFLVLYVASKFNNKVNFCVFDYKTSEAFFS